MKVHVEHKNDQILLKPIGVLDAAGARVLREEADQIDVPDAATVLVDLSDVPFMDSSGLGVLIALAKRAMRTAGRLRLVHPGEQPLRLVQLTQLDRFFEVQIEPA